MDATETALERIKPHPATRTTETALKRKLLLAKQLVEDCDSTLYKMWNPPVEMYGNSDDNVTVDPVKPEYKKYLVNLSMQLASKRPTPHR